MGAVRAGAKRDQEAAEPGATEDKSDTKASGGPGDRRCCCRCCGHDQLEPANARNQMPVCGQHLDDFGSATRNLDSGYAWVILVVMFLIQSSISGASRVYGIVYAKQVSMGYYDREQASWPIATASAIENLASLLTPALARYLSWRKIELLSTCLFISANLLAYASSSLLLDVLALGCIQGLALSTSTVLSLAINNDYFERYRTTAYGISMSGSTFGVLYLTPLVSWLLNSYDGFRLVYLALAVVFCFNILLVLFIKPRSDTIQRATVPGAPLAANVPKPSPGGPTPISLDKNGKLDCAPEQQSEAKAGQRLSCGGRQRHLSRFESHFERQNSIASISYRVRSRRSKSILNRTTTASVSATAATSTPAAGRQLGTGSLRLAHPALALAHKSVGRLHSGPPTLGDQQAADSEQKRNKQLGIKFSLSAGAITGQPVEQRQQNALDIEQLATKLGAKPSPWPEDIWPLGGGAPNSRSKVSTNNIDNKIEHQKGGKSGKVEPKCDQQQEQIDAGGAEDELEFSFNTIAKLLRSPYLHCTWIMLALYFLIARVFIIILVDFANDHGFSLAESTSLLNYWSMGELSGRILLGSLIDLQWLSCKSCIILTCATLSVCISSMVFFTSYYVYAACSVMIAALISLEYMLINVLIVEYMGKNCVTTCYSIAAFISSLVLFARPSMIGLFRDHLGSYDGLLLLLATVSFAYATLFLLLEPLAVRKWPKRQL